VIDLEVMYGNGENTFYSHRSSEIRFAKGVYLATLVSDLTEYNEFWKCSVADIGCGPGKFLDWCIAKNGVPPIYTGMDVRKSSIVAAKEKYPGFEFNHCDQDWGIANYDFCFGFGLLGHIVSDNKSISESNDKSLLRKLFIGATKGLVITLPRADFTKGSSMPLLRYTIGEAGKMVEELGKEVGKVMIDGVTFEHEYLIGIGKKKYV